MKAITTARRTEQALATPTATDFEAERRAATEAELTDAVDEMAAAAADGLAMIASMARVALQFMESPVAYEGYGPEHLAQMLSAMRDTAHSTANGVAGLAHGVIAPYQDRSAKARQEAMVRSRRP